MVELRKKLTLANIKILPKLLLVMLVLSWIPLSAAVGIGIKSRNDAIAFEMENTILEVISGAAQDIRQGGQGIGAGPGRHGLVMDVTDEAMEFGGGHGLVRNAARLGQGADLFGSSGFFFFNQKNLVNPPAPG